MRCAGKNDRDLSRVMSPMSNFADMTEKKVGKKRALPAWLESLRPGSGNHAIHEVVFNLFFTSDSSFSNPKEFGQKLQNALGKKFPKLQSIKVADALLTIDGERGPLPQSFSMSGTSDLGFHLDRFGPDGKLMHRIRAQNDAVPWIAANILKYTDWKPVLRDVHGWFRKAADIASQGKVAALSLHVIDFFYWEGNEKLPISKIFNKQSRFLPAKLDESVDKWQYRISYSHLRGRNRHTDNIEISVQTNKSTGRERILVSMVLRVDLASPLPFGDILKGSRENSFLALMETLHADNKENLRDLLSSDVAERIGLTQ